ncbi:MAG: hypothetical protein HYY84_15770 [Deltaproteobacteria bacterium]|nr:hypothetical protein [Deltaproteobacteria bacterium]
MTKKQSHNLARPSDSARLRVAFAAMAVVFACKEGGGDLSVPTPSTSVGELMGQVVSADDGGALGAVRVEVADAGVTYTNAAGQFVLHNVPMGDSVPVVCRLSGRVSYARSIRVAGGAMTTFHGWMPTLDAIFPITAEAPAPIDLAGTGSTKGFRFEPSPSAFVFDGGVVSGTVNVEFKVFDPTGESMRIAYPGTFEMVDDGGRFMTRSTSAVFVRVMQGANELSVAADASIVIDAPIPQGLAGTAADASALLAYDVAGGAWRNAGVASRVEKSGASVYRFVVNSLAWFNVGETLAQPVCVVGCVVDQRDAGLSDVPVQIVSADSSRFSTVAVTRDGGCYETTLPRGAAVTVKALDELALSAQVVNFTVPYDAGGTCAVIPAVAETAPDFVVMLTWDAGTNLDLHLTGPLVNGTTFHVCDAKTAVTDSQGASGAMTATLKTNETENAPEFATVFNPNAGTYRAYVIKDDIDQSKANLQLTGAAVMAWSRAGGVKRWALVAPAFAQSGVNLWNVFDVSFTSAVAAPTFTTLDEVRSVGGSTDTTSPAYCAP